MPFEADWLDLREPADHAARDQSLLKAAAERATGPVIDLGAGTGSTLRAFGDLAPNAVWHLVDDDATLLHLASDRHPDVQTHRQNLADLDALPLDGASLVTASALFDLMPLDWCEALADRLAANRVGLYAALNYDGKMSWEPALIEDPLIIKAFNTHQRTNKGLGPALGPDSGPVLKEILEKRGFTVQTADSPWHIRPSEADLHRKLVTGVAHAASETGSPFAENWRYARLAACSAADCTVGHIDIIALPG